jgi:hypothetical protein
MKQLLRYLLFLVFLAATIYSVQGVPYQYFTEHERSPLGESVRFFSGDTLGGAVRSNDTICMMQNPVFYDFVITNAPDFCRGVGFNPQFRDYDPVFNAPVLQYSNFANWTREQAQTQGRYFESGTYTRARVVFEDHNLRITWGVDSLDFDSIYFNYPLPDSCAIFFDCPVQISGTVYSTIIFGASGDIRLEDNIVYSGTDTTTGEIAEDETAKLVLVSETRVIVLNTWANGRDDQAQGSGIIINALIVALDSDSGHFTFDEQNDVWDDYIGPAPDERGQIHLTGSVYQKYRGYQHRSNNGGTGYLKDYKYDERLRYWQLPIFENPDFLLAPTVLDFDTVLVDGEYLDSIQIVLDARALIDIPVVSEGVFTTDERLYVFDSTLYVPIIFTPTETGTFSEEIPIYIEGNRYTIPVQGVSELIDDATDPVSLSPSSFILSCYPNPFNPTTTIQFDLPIASRVLLDVYNLAGRKVQSLADQSYNTGTHTLEFDGSGLPSGLYFARLQTNKQIMTTKLMLLK